MSADIRQLAFSTSTPPWTYNFIPTGYMECSADTNLRIFFGELEYTSPNYKMHGAFQIKDWLFTLEESVVQPGYYLCAFLGKEHFTFGKLKQEVLRNAQSDFMTTCMTDMLPVLYEAEMAELARVATSPEFTWKKVVL